MVAYTFTANTILFLSGAENYSNVHFTNGRIMMVSHNLGRVHDQSLPDFLRISKSTLVNPRYVVGWKRTSDSKRGVVTMVNGATLSISRRMLSKTVKFLRAYQVSPVDSSSPSVSTANALSY